MGSTLMITAEDTSLDRYTDAEGSSSWHDVSTPPSVFLSSTRNRTIRQYSGSDITTGDTIPTEECGKYPSISVSKHKSDFLGSFEDISTETLSDAQRLQAVPSGTFQKQSTMKIMKLKTEPTETPIKGDAEGHRAADV